MERPRATPDARPGRSPDQPDKSASPPRLELGLAQLVSQLRRSQLVVRATMLLRSSLKSTFVRCPLGKLVLPLEHSLLRSSAKVAEKRRIWVIAQECLIGLDNPGYPGIATVAVEFPTSPSLWVISG